MVSTFFFIKTAISHFENSFKRALNQLWEEREKAYSSVRFCYSIDNYSLLAYSLFLPDSLYKIIQMIGNSSSKTFLFRKQEAFPTAVDYNLKLTRHRNVNMKKRLRRLDRCFANSKSVGISQLWILIYFKTVASICIFSKPVCSLYVSVFPSNLYSVRFLEEWNDRKYLNLNSNIPIVCQFFMICVLLAQQTHIQYFELL